MKYNEYFVYNWRVCVNYTVCRLYEICIHLHSLTTCLLFIFEYFCSWVFLFSVYFPLSGSSCIFGSLCVNTLFSYVGDVCQAQCLIVLLRVTYLHSLTTESIEKSRISILISIYFSTTPLKALHKIQHNE